MTMICCRVRPERVELLTDGMAINHSLTMVSTVDITNPEIFADHHAAAATSGLVDVARVWNGGAGNVMEELGFDEFADNLRDTMGDDVGLRVVLVGWSPRHQRFKGYVAQSSDKVVDDISDELWLTPTPAGHPVPDAEIRHQDRADWSALSGEPLPPPSSDADWAELARKIHRDRSQRHSNTGLKHVVGGDVLLTTLTRSGVESRVVHRFDGDDFREVTPGTMHPLVQLQPCPGPGCDSGKPAIACCATGPEFLNQTCPCHSGQRFRDCCLVDPADYPDDYNIDDAMAEMEGLPRRAGGARREPARGKVGRNDPCPCGSGTKAKKCACQLAAV